MNAEQITSLFEDGGALVTPEHSPLIQSLAYGDVVSLFESRGVIVFRGFEVSGPTLSDVTDIYTEKYARDAMRRAQRFENKVVRDVDLGSDAHTLHSEASYSPAWPELIWFFCVVPAAQGGATTLCDGSRLWKALSTGTRRLFLGEPLRFDLEVPFGTPRPGRGREPWLSDTPGTTGTINWDEGTMSITQLRYAVHENRAGTGLCFCNHLLAELGKDPQIRNTAMQFASGTAVPDDVLAEIRERSAELTYEHPWKPRDLIMVDNKRFLHGRRAFSGPRDVVNVQTARASFGYGSTTRRTLRAAAHV